MEPSPVPAHHPAVRQPALHAGRGRPRGRLPARRPTARWWSGRPRTLRAAQHRRRPARPRRRSGRPSAPRSSTVFTRPALAGARGRVRGVLRAGGRGAGRTSPPGARSPRSTGCRAAQWPAALRDPASRGGRSALSRAGRPGRRSTLAAVGRRRAARRRPAHRARAPGWRSAWCTTSPSACTPTAPTPGRCRTRWPAGSRVGAPPDAFNQQGQDWSQPPWRPDRLAELRLRALPRHAAHRAAARRRPAHRPRHRAVPAVVGARPGAGPAEGTYVRYDHEALVGILALEAHRAGAS